MGWWKVADATTRFARASAIDALGRHASPPRLPEDQIRRAEHVDQVLVGARAVCGTDARIVTTGNPCIWPTTCSIATADTIAVAGMKRSVWTRCTACDTAVVARRRDD
jgi:hypothetical protein